MIPRQARNVGSWTRASRRRAYRAIGGFALVFALAGCSVAVNDDLAVTSTPYPVRSGLAATSAASPGSEVTSALETAEAALAQGDPDRAERVFNTVLAARPDQVAALVGRAAARVELGDAEGARQDLEAAVEQAPERPNLRLEVAAVAVRLADFDAALGHLDAAVAQDPGRTEAFVARGEVSVTMANGDAAAYGRALDDFGRALALDPTSGAARLARAELFLDRLSFRGDPADLDRAFAELDAVVAGGARGAQLRARAQAARGDIAAARATLAAPSIATTSLPPSPPAAEAATRAAVALSAREWDVATAAAADAIELDATTWEAHRLLAEAELARGDAAAALAAAERLLAAWSDDGPGLFLRGAALARLGREAEARTALDRASAQLVASPVYLARIAQVQSTLLTSATPP